MEIKSYWQVEPPAEPMGRVDTEQLNTLTDELYALLKESVKMRLISDVPLGAFLSGGIDSSAIVGLMRELGANPLKTFSIGFEDRTYDELDHARRVARAFDTEHEEFVLQPKALELTERLVRHLDEPLGDFSIFPTFLVSEMARRHVTVILSGDGGDELFAGYEHYQAQKLAQKPWLAPLHRALPPLVRRLPPSPKKKGVWNKLQRYCLGLEQAPGLRHFRWMTFLSDRDKGDLYSDALAEALGGIRPVNTRPPLREEFDAMDGFDATSGECFLDLRTYLVDDILVKVDRMSMAASLETRVPLLDHKIVEFIFRLPGDLKLRGMTTKWIFKKAMERLLPRENIYRRKEGFSIPIKHWLCSELKDLMLDHLNEERMRDGGYFHYPAVKRMIDRHLSGKANYSHQLWALLVFEIWRENWGATPRG
jgi:asparagine synthase (glutamine-hydrolysing)